MTAAIIAAGLGLSDRIEKYGSYAGLAAVLGLAVLSLLYFAQAREVKRLREWAGRSPERDAELQQRAVAAAQQRAIVQPQRPVPPAAAPVAPGARPAAATPAGQAAAPGAVPAAAAAATAAGAATATPGAPAAPAAPTPAGGQPTTVLPAANGAPAAAAASPPVRPGQPLRVPGSATPPPRTPEPEDEGRSRPAIFAAIGAIVLVAIIAVVLLTGALGGDGDTSTQKANTIGTPGADTAATGGSETTTGKTPTPSTTPKPGTYTVAVLNGTTVPGLARGVANRLQNTKFKIGNVTNAATQDRSATLVEFAPGHRAEADAVAKAIDVGADSIQKLSAGSKTIAGDVATVVVTVGSDQNTSPQTQTTP